MTYNKYRCKYIQKMPDLYTGRLFTRYDYEYYDIICKNVL